MSSRVSWSVHVVFSELAKGKPAIAQPANGPATRNTKSRRPSRAEQVFQQIGGENELACLSTSLRTRLLGHKE